MTIGEMLEQVMIEDGCSKTEFAKELGCNKSFLTRIFQGDRYLNEPMIQAILSSKMLSENSKNALREKFFTDHFGVDQFRQMKLFLEKLDQFDETRGKYARLNIHRENWDRIFSQTARPYILENKKAFLECAAYFCQKVFSAENAFFYSNYSFLHTELNSVLYTLFSKRDSDKSIDFVHLVSYPEQLTDYEITVIFEALKWGTVQLNTYHLSAEADLYDFLFPYYILTNHCVILFQEQGTGGIVFTDPSMIRYYKKQVLLKKAQCRPLLQFMPDKFDLIAETSPSEASCYYSIDGAMSGVYLDSALLGKIIRKEISSRDAVIRAIADYYDRENLEKRFNAFYSKRMLERFSLTGEITAIPSQYIPTCSPNIRIQVFERMKRMAAIPHNRIIQILDDKKLRFPENLNIEIRKDMTAFHYFFAETASAGPASPQGMFQLTLDSAHLVRLFSNLEVYLLKNGFCLKKEEINPFLFRLTVDNKLRSSDVTEPY